MAQLDSTIIYGNLKVTGDVYGYRVYGAVYNAGNDYAEYRLCDSDISAGYIVTECGDDKVGLCTTKSPKAKMFITSDTYGSCIGDKDNSVSVALMGRALLHVDKSERLKIGDYIGCSKTGTGRKMSRLEARLFPHRVVGTVSSIPTYSTWGKDNIQVNGRIWVNIK